MGQYRSYPWKRRILRSFFIVASIYVAAFVGLLLLEDRLLFRPATADELWRPPPEALSRLQNIELTVEGVRLHAWWCPSTGWNKDAGAALYCHGTGGNLSLWGPALASWIEQRGEAILIYDYPGYGKSRGTPSEAGCYAAAQAAYDWLVENQGVKPDRIIVIGQSLGTAVASHLAATHAHRALVLLSPFSSMPDMAAEKFPIFPGRWFIHNRFDNLENLGHCHGPVFIAHGTVDQVVPFQHAQKVLAAANEPKKLQVLEGVGHDVILDHAFFHALATFLETVEGHQQ